MNKPMRVFLSIVFLLLFSIVNVYGYEGFAECKNQAELGDAYAQHDLAFRYLRGDGIAQDSREAEKWFRKAAEQGYAEAQYDFARLYIYGDGIAQDSKKAVKWLRKAAEQGHAEAQNLLAIMYVKGDGVVQDISMAHMFWNIASANGLAVAKENRVKVASMMTSEEIAIAQKMAKEWMEKH